MTIKMYAPFVGNSKPFYGSDGNRVTPDANGVVSINEKDLMSFISAGFVFEGEPFIRRAVVSNNANSVIPANCLAFGKRIALVIKGGAALTHTFDTANNIVAVRPNTRTEDTWLVRILNKNSGNLTLADGANAIANGTKVIAANRWADFMVHVFDMGEEVGPRMIFYNVGQGPAV